MSIRKFNLNIFITQTPFPNNCWKHHVVSRHHRSLSHTCKIYARVINQTINTKIGSSLSTKASIKKCRWSSLLLSLFQFRSTYTDTCISHPYRHRDSCHSITSIAFEHVRFARIWEKGFRDPVRLTRDGEMKLRKNFVKFSSKMRISLIRDEEAVHARFTGQDRATYPGYIGRTGTSERSSKRCVTVKR